MIEIGKKYGEWTVLEFAGRNTYSVSYYLCSCSCGRTKKVRGTHLQDGSTKSCGCLVRTRGGDSLDSSSAYYSWQGMMSRCYYEKNKEYHNYGGQGIRVCASWHDYENFKGDMGERPTGLTLGRIDNNKGYSLENCRWETPRQQANNRKTNVLLTWGGEAKTLAQWSRHFDYPYKAFHKRVTRAITRMGTHEVLFQILEKEQD